MLDTLAALVCAFAAGLLLGRHTRAGRVYRAMRRLHDAREQEAWRVWN